MTTTDAVIPERPQAEAEKDLALAHSRLASLTNSAMISVPEGTLRELLRTRNDGSQVYADVEALLPKLPRLVAVTLEQWGEIDDIRDLPDLLTLLDEAIDSEVTRRDDADRLMARIRTTFGLDS